MYTMTIEGAIEYAPLRVTTEAVPSVQYESIGRRHDRRMIMATSKKGSAKKTTAKKATSQGTRTDAGRGSNQGLMRAVQPSAELAAIVGQEPMPRTEITKRIWDYIKAHKLQDASNKRLINADAQLQPVFGGKKQVSMFELAKLVSQHVQ
jgi:upstream activation factor subunit UAF30